MILGVNGRKNSGKDTVARMIQYHTSVAFHKFKDVNDWLEITEPFYTDNTTMYGMGAQFEIHKFAGKLKEMLSILLGVPISKLEDREYKESVLPEQWWYYQGEVGIYEYPNEYPANRKLPLIKPTVRDLMITLGTSCGRDLIHPNIWVNATLATYIPEVDWVITDLRFGNEYLGLKRRDAVLIQVVRPDIKDDWDPIDHKLDHITDWDYRLVNDGDYSHLYRQVAHMMDKIKK